MPVERIIAGVIVLLVALFDYLGVMKPLEKLPEKEEAAETVTVSANASIKLPEEIGSFRMDGTVIFPCEIQNTGEAMHTFVVSVDMKGQGAQKSLPVRRVSLEPGEAQTIEMTYKVQPDLKEGQYAVAAAVWEKLEDEKPARKYAEAVRQFRLFDAFPAISFMDLGLSAQVGGRLSLKVRITDDRGVRWAKVTYLFPGMKERKVISMERKSGTEKDGTWSFTTDPSRQTGQFIFKIEAMDSKSQIAKTEEYKIAIVTKQ